MEPTEIPQSYIKKQVNRIIHKADGIGIVRVGTQGEIKLYSMRKQHGPLIMLKHISEFHLLF